MTDTDLGEYEGLPVRKLGIEVRNTSGGLNKAMKVRPERIHPGDTRFVVYEVDFEKFRFDPIFDDDDDTEIVAWELVAIGSANTAAFLPEGVVRQAIDDMKAAITKAEDEAKNLKQIPTPEDLSNEHATGAHDDDKYQGCPDCYPDAAGSAPPKKPKGPAAAKTGAKSSKSTSKATAKKTAKKS